jgi:hypothetical protein
LARLPGWQSRSDRQSEKTNRRGSQRHAARLASPFRKMRLESSVSCL